MELKLIPINAENPKNIPINATNESLLKAKFITNTKPRGANIIIHPNIDVPTGFPNSSYFRNKPPSSGLYANSNEAIVVIPKAKNIHVNTDAKSERSFMIVALSILFKLVFLKFVSMSFLV